MRELHWTRHIADAQFCRELAEAAEKDGQTIRKNYWLRIEREKVRDAEEARERQSIPSWSRQL